MICMACSDTWQAASVANTLAHMSSEAASRSPLLMAEKAESMLNKSLDAVVNMDLDMAVNVCLLDDEVDDFQNEAYDVTKQAIKDDPDRVAYLINLLLISRHLERIADHATNIAEEVVYMIEGEIVRHGRLATEPE